MDMPSIDPKRWLVGELTGKAVWYRRVASLFPNDERSMRCSNTLQMLAAAVKALPDTHPLFDLLEQIDHVGDEVHARWLSELCLEFSHIAWFSPSSTQQAIKQLMEITDDSLCEWRRAKSLH
jgi:hypothetical protein